MKSDLKICDKKRYNLAVFIVHDQEWYADNRNPVELSNIIHTNSLKYAYKIIHSCEETCNRCNYTMYVFNMETKTPLYIYKDEENNEIRYSELTYADKNFTDADFYNNLLQSVL